MIVILTPTFFLICSNDPFTRPDTAALRILSYGRKATPEWRQPRYARYSVAGSKVRPLFHGLVFQKMLVHG